MSRYALSTKRDYVKAATGIGGDFDVRAALRKRMRGRIGASPLGDAKSLGAAIEDVLHAAWAGELPDG